MPIDQSDKILKELLELKPEEYRVITSKYKHLTTTKTIISKVWFVTGYSGSRKTTEVNNILRNIREIQEKLSGNTKIVVIDAQVLWDHSGQEITEKNKLFLKQLFTYARVNRIYVYMYR
ncbi:hypothetical protein [Enterococcus faecalis]|uniref:Uncharacterized protein n=1 Tax=Enterococcus faecalis RP2S-4 TaxID=1244145 RepID=A0ABC9TLF7_ENTFL|nr:hypothetical protein [Enterococcus faecalis]EPI08707.1 hypothetical protein D358_01482 [Enterococcus faecalis RP2S-4]